MLPNPGHRILHNTSQVICVVKRHEIIRIVVRNDTRIESLQEYASKERRTFADLVTLSKTASKSRVACGGDIASMRHEKLVADRDTARENSQTRMRYLLIYEELTWSMNAGDVGRVEFCLSKLGHQ